MPVRCCASDLDILTVEDAFLGTTCAGRMETTQSILSLIESALTSIAIIVAGVWGYYLFWRRRSTYPRAALELQVTTARLPRDKRLLHVGLRIENQSDVLLRVRSAEVRVRQVVPIPVTLQAKLQKDVDPIPTNSTEYPWPAIVSREWRPEGSLELEPGEWDMLHSDFVIEDSIGVVELYAFVENTRKTRAGLGWTRTVLCTLTNEVAMIEKPERNRESLPRPERTEKQQRQQPRQPGQQVQQIQEQQQLPEKSPDSQHAPAEPEAG